MRHPADIEELTYQEIVDILESPSHGQSRINRGRIELAKILRRLSRRDAVQGG